jgi:hypothetical protein
MPQLDNDHDEDKGALAQRWVKGVIRSEMVKRGFTYATLAERLILVGIDDDEKVLRNKISRGSFSAAFFAQVLAGMGVKTLTVDLLDYIMNPNDLGQRAKFPPGWADQ